MKRERVTRVGFWGERLLDSLLLLLFLFRRDEMDAGRNSSGVEGGRSISFRTQDRFL